MELARTTRRDWLLAAVATPWAAGCAAPRAPAPDFDRWSEDFAAEAVRLSPLRASWLRYFSGAEQAALDRLIEPQAAGPWTRSAPLLREGLAQLARFDTAALPPARRLAADTLRWSLDTRLRGAPFEDHVFVFNQFWGVQVQLVNFLAEQHPLSGPDGVDSFLARLELLGARIDEARERATAAAARGLRPPRFIAERARGQVAAMLAGAPADDPLVAGLARRSAGLAGLDAGRRAAALRGAEDLVARSVRPAFRRLLDWFDALLPATGDDAGLWRFADGEAAYAAFLAQYTTTALTAREIHAIGLRDVAAIEAQMDAVLRRLGRRDGSVAERMRALSASLQPPAEPDPRPALLERYRSHVRDAQQRAAALFRLMPRAPIEVRREPALTEATAAAWYASPAIDGSRPGVFWVSLPGPQYDVLRMRSLAVHEAVPGHHFQFALVQELPGLLRWQRLQVFGGGSASWEGWALYAEQLAIEQGWYADDPHALLGALSSQLFRARRLVVDTGLHAFRWTRQRAIDYGISPAEVERYVAIPGQACSYRVAMLRLLALRDEARSALGTRFTLPDFHDAVLRAGAVPLDVLADAVRRWIDRPPA
jgi:uncharacterized protein (DUF885 family)